MQALPLRRARLDEVLRLEDPQHLAGDGRRDRPVRVGEPVDEPGSAGHRAAWTSSDAATNPNGQ